MLRLVTAVVTSGLVLAMMLAGSSIDSDTGSGVGAGFASSTGPVSVSVAMAQPLDESSDAAPGLQGEVPIPWAADLDEGMLWDEPGLPPMRVDTQPAGTSRGPLRLALPPGVTATDLGIGAGAGAAAASVEPTAPQQVQQWRVDNGESALRITNVAPGPNHGIANRFDPSDFADTDGLPPRPLRIRKIFFEVSTATSPEPEPTGPMEWHIWEDNGGHKADSSRDIVPPFVVTGGPGENVIDLVALGIDAVIDPPRMFHIGVAHKESNETSPDLLLDSGLPYVGPSGDFHASITYFDDNCRKHTWRLLALDAQDGKGPRSPAWMAWLEVEWLEPPARLYFEELARKGSPAGDFESGSRIAWGDYDGDGLEDILASGRKLYRNEGDGTFTDVTDEAGITDVGAGAIWGDYDNDGDLDFFQYTNNCVPCGKEDNYDDLWRNKGDGTFESVREVDYDGDPNAPVPRDPLPTEAAAWGDFNGDGYLDLYAANHVDWKSGRCFVDYLWINEGPPSYGFRDASIDSGIRSVTLCGRGVNPADFDGDGDLDIFVSNYRLNRDLLWVNTGPDLSMTPHFENEAGKRGVEGRAKITYPGAYGHTIGSVWGDLDNDLDQDLVASRLAHSAWLCFSDTTMVYASDGDPEYKFTDVRKDSGVEYVETHSDPSLVDIDNDGYLDLHITHVYDGWRSSTYRNVTGQTEQSGAIRFENITHVSGIYPRTSWGSGWSDFDRDGDMDLAAKGLWRNLAGHGDSAPAWLQVEVLGCGRSNRDAIGAKVALREDGETYALREIVAARGTGSQDSRVQHFGLGDRTSVDELLVTFPSGQQQVLHDVAPRQRISVTEVGAFIVPDAWIVRAGQALTIRGDSCGTDRELRWDLDGDGRYDDATGPVVETVYRKPREHQPIAVEVVEGDMAERTRVTIQVVPGDNYLPAVLRGFAR